MHERIVRRGLEAQLECPKRPIAFDCVGARRLGRGQEQFQVLFPITFAGHADPLVLGFFRRLCKGKTVRFLRRIFKKFRRDAARRRDGFRLFL